MHPTRCTPSTASLIDHIITNSAHGTFETVLLTSKISDHFPVVFFLEDPKPKHKLTAITYRNFSEESINTFKDALSSINWNMLIELENVQERYDKFSEIFLCFTI